MTLYEIDKALDELMENGYNAECIDAETGEFLEDKFVELMEGYEADRSVKIENIALLIKDLLADAEMIKAEEKRLADRRKSKENKAEHLKNYLAASLRKSGDNKFESPKCALSFRKSIIVVCDNDKLDKKYMNEKIEYSPDKKAIKEAIQNGTEVAGAYLEERQNLQIK